MIPVFQTRKGTEGNCWAACLASVFEVSIETVDQCAGNRADWREQTDRWLAERGFYYLELNFIDSDSGQKMPCTSPPDGAVVICGCTTERGLKHAVIGQIKIIGRHPDGQAAGYEIYVIHDPIPGGSKSYKIDAMMLLCPLDPVAVPAVLPFRAPF